MRFSVDFAACNTPLPAAYLKRKLEIITRDKWLRFFQKKMPLVELTCFDGTRELLRQTACRIISNFVSSADMSPGDWNLLKSFSKNEAYCRYLIALRSAKTDIFVLADSRAVFFLEYRGNICSRVRVFADRLIFAASKREMRFLRLLRDVCHMSLCRTKGILLHASGV
ncbi:MAG TPA: hypothetical protein PKL77_10000, partial [Candidatus Omnitrophota bacterium]|nr:hypothetical protein [Candidatus Omnitrophota bacterium]